MQSWKLIDEGFMRLIKSIRFSDRGTVLWIYLISITFTVIYFFLSDYVAKIHNPSFKLQHVHIDLMGILFHFIYWYVIVIALIILIISTFCKLFDSRASISLSFKNGMMFVSNPKAFHRKNNYIVIMSSPLVILSVLSYILLLIGSISSFDFVIISLINGGASSGYLYTLARIIDLPKNVVIRDSGLEVNAFLPEL